MVRDEETRAPRHHEVDSPLRKVIVDIGAASSRRHAVPAWFTADITEVWERLQARGRPSPTAYVANSLARMVPRHPRLHAARDLRGRVVIFDDVDVNISIEVEPNGHPFPMRTSLALPAPLRSRLLGSVRRFPNRQKALMGTVGLTSVGTYGGGGGLGLPFLVHTLEVLVGGLETRPGYHPDGAVGLPGCTTSAV